jgi:hypothetical protein
MLREVQVSVVVDDPVESLTWTLFGGVVELAGGSFYGTTGMGAAEPDIMIPIGTLLSIHVAHDTSAHQGLEVSLIFERHS